MSDDTIDVLICGSGPAGTALAIDLVRRGLKIRIIDKAAHSFDGSRAKGIQPRTLEVLEDLGALDDILSGGTVYPLLGLHIGPVTVPWRMMKKTEPTDAVPYSNTWLIPQNRTDGALHAQLERAGQPVEYGTELVELTQDAHKITATLTGPDGDETVTARYLVGADGGSSAVRKKAGIDFTGSTDEADRMLIVDAEVTGLNRDRWHMWPRLGGRFIGACPIPHSDLFQVMIRLSPDEQPPEGEDQITARIQKQTGNRKITVRNIQWRSVFRPNIRLAESYRRGRVFIAGDAAHVHTPAGAQGLNTGIQDAYNLGWKLAQVLAGANEQLLDSYEAERQPIAAKVLGLSTAKYEGIAKLDPSSIRRGTDEQQLKLTYHGGPLAPNSSDKTTTLTIGDRAPDTKLFDAEGNQIRLFDLYHGPHFTALAYGNEASEALDQLDWPSAGTTLTRVAINAQSAKSDHLLTDTHNTMQRTYGINGDTLLLIRPDGYIGHIATNNLKDSTLLAVHAMTPART